MKKTSKILGIFAITLLVLLLSSPVVSASRVGSAGSIFRLPSMNRNRIVPLDFENINLWLTNGELVKEKINCRVHTIELSDISENEDYCGLAIDGYSKWIGVGKTELINGVLVTANRAVKVHAQIHMVLCSVTIKSIIC